MATGMAFAVEYQGEATPHAHGFVSLANMYQCHNLHEIGQIIEHNARQLTPQQVLERITSFVEHIQREDHIDDNAHQEQLQALEKQFHDNNAGAPENIHLSVRPCSIFHEGFSSHCWSGSQDIDWESAFRDGKDFKERYHKDAQFIFSRVQHHWHALDDKGA